MSHLKKFISQKRALILAFVLTVTLLASRPALASIPGSAWALGGTVGEFLASLTSGKLNAESSIAHLMTSVMQYWNGILGGCDKETDPACPDEFADGGLNAMLADATIKTSINPPASSKEYLADLGQSIGIIPKPAYAQGVGYEGFIGILELWKQFRNLTYLALVIVFVVIGFMIMFRKKLNPQTVITIQEAIPRLIVTMLLITFSYAIAGLLLDLSQVAIRLIGATFKATGFVAIRNGTLEAIFDKNIFELMNPLRQTGQLVNALQKTTVHTTSAFIFAIFLNCILFFATFYIMIKTFVSLIGPYIQIALSIVFAPFQLLLGAIPGNNNALSKWAKGLLANAMVFPVVLSMLFLAAIFKSGDGRCFGASPKHPSGWESCGFANIWGMTDWSTKTNRIQVNFPSPGIGNWGGAIGELIGLGILFMIPKAVEMTKAFIMGKEFPGGEAAMGEIYKNLGKVPMLGKILGS